MPKSSRSRCTPNIVVPVVTADIRETNQVDVLGTSILQALQDVSLLTNSGIGDDRASTSELLCRFR